MKKKQPPKLNKTITFYVSEKMEKQIKARMRKEKLKTVSETVRLLIESAK